MSLFRYRALTSFGKKVSGVIDADTRALAKEKLSHQDLLLTELHLVEASHKEPTLKPALLLTFTKEMGQLLRAGLPLYESLLSIEEKYRKHPSHTLFIDLCDSLKSGASFSKALKKYPKTFNEIYISMIEAAEATSSLPFVFEQLSLLIARQQKLKKQLSSALIYPAFLASFCCIVIGTLLFFIIPTMKELFEDRALHPMTQIVLAISQAANDHLLLLVMSALLLFTSTAFLFKYRKPALLALLFKTPFIKSLLLDSALIRFARASSILLMGGLTLVETLRLAKDVLHFPPLEQAIKAAEIKLLEGKKLSETLQHPLIPPLITRMLATAEETGKLAPMFQNIADIHEEQLESHLQQLTTFLQPVILLLLGAIIGLVVLSILLPLTDVSSFIEG